MWLKYGLLTNENSIVLVNSIGAVLFFIYTIIYYIFTVNKTSMLRQVFLTMLVILGVIIYTNQDDNYVRSSFVLGDYALINYFKETILKKIFLGIICCFVTVLFVAAPLSLLMHVIRVKNTDCLPFPLILMAFVVSLLWFIYGILIIDLFLQVKLKILFVHIFLKYFILFFRLPIFWDVFYQAPNYFYF